jgi:hypothetical protein
MTILHSFKFSDLSEHYIQKMQELNEIKKQADCPGLGYLILEDFGTALEQRDWTDVTGYFVRFRVAPLASKNLSENLINKFTSCFMEKFPGKIKFTSSVKDNIVTLVSLDNMYSIGD